MNALNLNDPDWGGGLLVVGTVSMILLDMNEKTSEPQRTQMICQRRKEQPGTFPLIWVVFRSHLV